MLPHLVRLRLRIPLVRRGRILLSRDIASPKNQAKRLRGYISSRALLLKSSSEGCFLFSRDQSVNCTTPLLVSKTLLLWKILESRSTTPCRIRHHCGERALVYFLSFTASSQGGNLDVIYMEVGLKGGWQNTLMCNGSKI